MTLIYLANRRKMLLAKVPADETADIQSLIDDGFRRITEFDHKVLQETFTLRKAMRNQKARNKARAAKLASPLQPIKPRKPRGV